MERLPDQSKEDNILAEINVILYNYMEETISGEQAVEKIKELVKENE